jgi:ATP-dependent DNA helicase RecG
VVCWLFKDVITEERLRKQGLNERQIKAVLHVKENGSITNSQYQKLTGIAKATATRDLAQLVEYFKLFKKSGTTGVGTSYILKGS